MPLLVLRFIPFKTKKRHWIPAFAGMTVRWSGRLFEFPRTAACESRDPALSLGPRPRNWVIDLEAMRSELDPCLRRDDGEQEDSSCELCESCVCDGAARAGRQAVSRRLARIAIRTAVPRTDEALGGTANMLRTAVTLL